MSESKIPLLGDIPWLGNAFKRKQKQNVKTELMIFLTPQIVAAPSQLASMTAEERRNSMLKPKAISEEEIQRIIDGLPVKGSPDVPKTEKKHR
jgi:general secretion pathway protein D